MAAIGHTGKWGTPELGLTELLAKGIGAVTGQRPSTDRNTGGSQLVLGANDYQRNIVQPTQQAQQNFNSGPAAQKSTYQYNAPLAGQTSGGGGGGGGGTTQAVLGGWNNTGYQDQGAHDLARAQQDAASRLPGEVDNAYSDVYSDLSRQESDLRGGEQNLYNSFTQPYDAQRPILDQGFQQGNQLIGQQGDEVRQQEANALVAARRLYQQLTQNVRQRFGGSNSAGEYAGAIAGREFQRNQGQIQSTSGKNMQSLQAKAQELQQSYTAQLSQLEMQKQAALSQAKDVFNQRLAAINNARLTANQNKAQLKLQALQELRGQISQVQSQALQMQQQLQSSVQQMQGQLAANVQGFNAQAGRAVDMNAIPNAVYSSFGGSQQVTPASYINNVYGNYNPDDEKRRQGFLG